MDAQIGEAAIPRSDGASAAAWNERDVLTREGLYPPVTDELTTSGLHVDEDVDLIVAMFADGGIGTEANQVRIEIAVVRQAPDNSISTTGG